MPYILLWSTKISMFGLGVVFSILVFIYSSYQYCKSNQLDFRTFFFSLPWLFLLIYFVGKLVGSILESNISLNSDSLLFVLSPNGSEFHYVWIALGSFLALLLFLFNKGKNNIKNIIDMVFFSAMRTAITMWIFLTLSDYVIGKPNDHWRFAIRSLVPYSKISQFGQVYPYGLVISWLALLSYILTKVVERYTNRSWVGYLWFAIFFLLMNYWFGYQLYTRHWVSNFLGMNFDIKHYTNFIFAIICFFQYYRLNSNNNIKLG